jgi:hypothetical protein
MIRVARGGAPLFAGLLLAAILLLAPAARGQGTSGSLPGPISSSQLMRFADRLALSDQQRLAAESIHDDYKRQFRLLRDGEIAAFLQEQQSMQGGIPQREAVEKLLEEQQRLRAKIKALDDQFFDRLLPILTEAQQEQVPRLRLVRERQRYENPQATAMFGRGDVDLSELFFDLDLPPAAFEVADPMIAQYERRLTTLKRKQSEAMVHMTLNMMDALTERGFADISQEELMSDPERLQKLVDVMQAVYAELNVDVAKIAADISDLNRRTYRNVAAVIPDEQARRLRNNYYRQGYRELAPLIAQAERDWMRSALKLEQLTEEQRRVLAEAADTFQIRLDRTLAKGIDLVEGFWREFSPFSLDQDRMTEFRKKLSALYTEAEKARTEITASLEETLGAETVEEIRDAVGRAASAAPAAGPGGPEQAGASDAGDAEPPEFLWSGDRFLPPRISRRDINEYAEQLELDEGMRDVVSSLHADYVEQYKQLAVIEELTEANRTLWQYDPDTGVSTSPTREKIEAVYDLRRRAIAAMIELDDAFFDKLAVVADREREDRVQRLHLDRLRRTYAGARAELFALGEGASSEAAVDVKAIVMSRDLPPEEMKRLDSVLDVYRKETIPAFQRRLEAQLDRQQVMDQWSADMQAAVSDGVGAIVERQQRYADIIAGPDEALEQASRAIIKLNRRTLAAVLDELTGESAASVRRAYDRAAFPSVYNDPGAVDRQLTAAMALEDLTVDQRRQLDELVASYRPEYERLSRSLCDQLGPVPVNVVGFDAEDFKAWQEQQQEMARLRYDRNELNAGAINRLKALLSDDQLRRLGPLPEPQEAEDGSILGAG